MGKCTYTSASISEFIKEMLCTCSLGENKTLTTSRFRLTDQSTDSTRMTFLVFGSLPN